MTLVVSNNAMQTTPSKASQEERERSRAYKKTIEFDYSLGCRGEQIRL